MWRTGWRQQKTKFVTKQNKLKDFLFFFLKRGFCLYQVEREKKKKKRWWDTRPVSFCLYQVEREEEKGMEGTHGRWVRPLVSESVFSTKQERILLHFMWVQYYIGRPGPTFGLLAQSPSSRNTYSDSHWSIGIVLYSNGSNRQINCVSIF